MADPCPRCGLPFVPYGPRGSCEGELPNEPGVIDCRDREIELLKGRLAASEARVAELASEPVRLVRGCPYCGGNHVIQSFGAQRVFACPKAPKSGGALFADELLQVEEYPRV